VATIDGRGRFWYDRCGRQNGLMVAAFASIGQLDSRTQGHCRPAVTSGFGYLYLRQG